MYVYTPCILYDIIANNYSRTITRLYALIVMGKGIAGKHFDQGPPDDPQRPFTLAFPAGWFGEYEGYW